MTQGTRLVRPESRDSYGTQHAGIQSVFKMSSVHCRYQRQNREEDEGCERA
jgi:hypothetical protein